MKEKKSKGSTVSNVQQKPSLQDIAYIENPYAKSTQIIGKDIFLRGKEVKKMDLLDLSLYKGNQISFVTLLKRVRPRGVINAELHNRQDHLHERRSGMNHVLFAKLCELQIPYFLNLSLVQDPVYIGRMMQNIVLARKANTALRVVTLAKKEQECAARKDIEGLLRILGVDTRTMHHAFL